MPERVKQLFHTGNYELQTQLTFEDGSDVILITHVLGFGLGLLWTLYSLRVQQAKAEKGAHHQYTAKQHSGSPQLVQLILAL